MFWGVFERTERVKAGNRLARLAGSAADDDLVALDLETTSLDRRSAEIVALGAVRIRGNRILTGQRLDLRVKPAQSPTAASVRVHQLRVVDVVKGMPIGTALEHLVAFIGPRPLVGYFLEFDLAVINRALDMHAGLRLTNRAIEVSSLYYDYRARRGPYYLRGTEIDLRFDAILEALKLPRWPKHDAVNDAVMAALIYLKLRELTKRT